MEKPYKITMLSPRLHSRVRINESQLLVLSDRAKNDAVRKGYLQKKSADGTKWKPRWFLLYQNLLFYYDSEMCQRPRGILLLEGSYCDRGAIATTSKYQSEDEYCLQHVFEITYRVERQRKYEFMALTDDDCNDWIRTITDASFTKLMMTKEELEQKHLHLLQILESERTAKWQYTHQCEELSAEIKKLRVELVAVKRECRSDTSSRSTDSALNDDSLCARFEYDPHELWKIKKVQSFLRGWLCRRRWKQIVEQYIKSPHAESMRKRNSLVFRMVEAEEEYMEQMEVLVTCFLRPFKMAASSKKPPCSHEDVNSIFLNTETVLFLHQIFLKGLTARLENWPTLVLGDLFSMLLPMLNIYQEYVRNHHYSLQVLTECKQSNAFNALLKRLEEKPACRGRTLETFLTYPMHQVPRYIITLHELLAHTPHDHVERKSLVNARQKLEDLSRQMHDEVSETENLRINLSVERMIIEGCDILLDVNQVFVRQGNLIQLTYSEKVRGQKNLLSFKYEKEVVRQCFLFSNHLIIATRAENGRLHLLPDIGKIPLVFTVLIEDSSEEGDAKAKFMNKDFKLIVRMKSRQLAEEKITIHFVAASAQDKAAWMSDLSQCIDNVQFTDMLRPPIPDDGSLGAIPMQIRNDEKLFVDEPDIRFSRTLNSCKVPQIRYATPERLLERLTDLRFLSIDFLNTFLLTYRVFTDATTVLNALRKVFYTTDHSQQLDSLLSLSKAYTGILIDDDCSAPRRVSGASSVSGYGSEVGSDRDRSHSYDSQGHRQWRSTLEKYDEESQQPEETAPLPYGIKIGEEDRQTDEKNYFLTVPKVRASSSSDTLTDTTLLPAPESPGNLSSTTLVPGDGNEESSEMKDEEASPKHIEQEEDTDTTTTEPEYTSYTSSTTSDREDDAESEDNIAFTTKQVADESQFFRSLCDTVSMTTSAMLQNYYAISRRSVQEGTASSRSSFQLDSPQKQSKAGVVITSARPSKRRSSTSSSATAFAIATSASSNPKDISPSRKDDIQLASKNRYKESLMSTACTMRVLNVLRHWISKYSQDFEDEIVRNMTIEFLDDIVFSPNLLPVEHKTACQLLRLLTEVDLDRGKINVMELFEKALGSCAENIETLSALEIAEQLAFISHEIFASISCEELLRLAWTRNDKAIKAPNVLLMTKHFNDISRLVSTEIIKRNTVTERATVIEKWIAVADISRCLHNYNGILQITSAFANSAIFRLKKTWEKVSKTAKSTLKKLQDLVSSNYKFRAMRDALHRCDPPCVPYLGMYLTDLTFIEEGTPNYTFDGLLNFSKMRMIAHVIREIRHFQQTRYKISMSLKTIGYLTDTSLIMDEEELYRISLEYEPRTSRLSQATLGPFPPFPTVSKH